MASSGVTRANENKRIREEALREQLRAKGLVQQILVIADKLENLSTVLEPNDVARLKASADIKKALVNKYLPDLKAIEHTGEITHHDASKLTDSELAAIATGSGTGTTGETESTDVVH